MRPKCFLWGSCVCVKIFVCVRESEFCLWGSCVLSTSVGKSCVCASVFTEELSVRMQLFCFVGKLCVCARAGVVHAGLGFF